MKKTFADLPDWSFEVREVSAGVFEVTGTDGADHRAQMEGTNYDALLYNARNAITQLASE